MLRLKPTFQLVTRLFRGRLPRLVAVEAAQHESMLKAVRCVQFEKVLEAYKGSSRQWSSTLNRFAEGMS